MDIEGEDINAVKSIDYKRFRPTVIMYEAGHVDSDMKNFMKENGYVLFSRNRYNPIFILGGRAEKLDLKHLVKEREHHASSAADCRQSL